MLVIQHRAQDDQEIRAEYAEIDVMMTEDRVVVCRHDHRYKGVPVWSQNYVPDMGPTLKDFVEACPAKLFVELKLGSLHVDAGIKDFEQQVLVQSPGAFAYLSFDFRSIYELRKLAPNATLLANAHGIRLPAPFHNLRHFANGICVPLLHATHHLRAHDLPTYVYGVNGPSEVAYMPIKGVITDYPELWK